MLCWAVIGSGDVVSRLVKNSFHIPGKSSVKYIYSKKYDEAKKISLKYKLGKPTKNIKLIINDNQINSIYIATTPDSHAHYAKMFAKLKKNILCEKPLALNLKDINEIKKLCSKNKINLVTSFYRRHLKRFEFIKDILNKKKIGKVVYFNYSLIHSPKSHPTAPIKSRNFSKLPWRFKKSISGGGNFLDMGAHAIDMIIYLLGDIRQMHSLKRNYLKLYNVEDTLITNIELKNNLVGQAMWSSVTNLKSDKFEIFGTNGTIKFSLNFSDKVEILTNNKKITKNISFEKPFHKNIIRHTINIFLKNKKIGKYFIDRAGIDVAKHQINAIN